jgi:hypothetical protein
VKLRTHGPGLVLAALLASVPVLAGKAAPATAGQIQGSRLALRTIPRDSGKPLLLAQRTISREWGPSEDSTYTVIEVPDYKSEGWAMAMSGAVPGAGHFYVGEGSGIWYTVAEAAGWAALLVFRDRADQNHTDSRKYAGRPEDPNSNWSFSRYFAATAKDTVDLEHLYLNDPDTFYHLIGFDSQYKIGWRYDPSQVRDGYQVLENRWQRYLKRARYATGAIILNHLVSAVDALRAARDHNLPLKQNLRFKLRGSLEESGPAMSIAVEKGF